MNRGETDTAEAWSETYRRHTIAGRRQGREWLLLIDGHREAIDIFDSPSEAAAWLRLRVDALIAEEHFPGLRLERLGNDCADDSHAVSQSGVERT